MPAMLDDPTAPVFYRTSGPPPYPTPKDPQLPPSIIPRQVTLRDRVTIATLIPFSSHNDVPPSLLVYLCDQFGREIIKGDTYPMMAPLPLSSFGTYWFQNFGAVMLLGEFETPQEVIEIERNGTDWGKVCLGSFYIKPNYPGRSSHICNGGFLVTDAARGRGVGRLMGEVYLEWAPMLGYNYSVFNLVYENNVASCRIWDALGFKRIGRIKGAGNLRSHPNELVDAIIYGRDLGPEGEDFVSEERFDKIRFYLKQGKYPNGADRAEKSRLRSAATHYKLIPAEDGSENDRLMLKDKEVVADPQRQYEIARQVHAQQHGGINKTTATIAEKYHWVRIKETVSLVIKNCPYCKETSKVPTVRPEGGPSKKSSIGGSAQDPNAAIERLVNFDEPAPKRTRSSRRGSRSPMDSQSSQAAIHQQSQIRASLAPMQGMHGYGDIPLDPQIMDGVQHHHPSSSYHQHGASVDGYGMQADHHLSDDTRLATDEHVHRHNHPMVYQAGGGSGAVLDDGIAERTDMMEADGDHDSALKHHLLEAGYGTGTGN